VLRGRQGGVGWGQRWRGCRPPGVLRAQPNPILGGRITKLGCRERQLDAQRNILTQPASVDELGLRFARRPVQASHQAGSGRTEGQGRLLLPPLLCAACCPACHACPASPSSSDTLTLAHTPAPKHEASPSACCPRSAWFPALFVFPAPKQHHASVSVLLPAHVPQTEVAFQAYLQDAQAFYLQLAAKLQQRYGDAGFPLGAAAAGRLPGNWLQGGREPAGLCLLGGWRCGPALLGHRVYLLWPSPRAPTPPTHTNKETIKV
jgi:hypothetical protein